jgi:ferric-dicitrate binding protein FerR (iron transport regulator)
MDYSSYQTTDFLTDDSFVQYCYNDNKAAVAKWEAILVEHPPLSKNIGDARELCLLLGIKVSPAEKAAALNRLKAAINQASEVEEPQYQKTINIKKHFTGWLAIAATLLVMAGAFAVYQFNAPPSGAKLYSAATDVNYTTVGSTDFDHRKHIVLPDGTSVLLNGSSTLKIAKDYNASNRHVLLVGEAFFEVTKNKHKPFVVITGKTATTALGTSFKVQSYPGEAVASVMLSTGKVKVESTRPDQKVDDVLLIPGQQAVLTNGETAFKQSTFYATSLQNWIDRKLIFKSAGLDEISAKIKATYGITITPVNKPADGVSFTGEFTGKNLTEVLYAISFTNHFTYKQEGSTVKLNF